VRRLRPPHLFAVFLRAKKGAEAEKNAAFLVPLRDEVQRIGCRSEKRIP
jgi:hypothetical protein